MPLKTLINVPISKNTCVEKGRINCGVQGNLIEALSWKNRKRNSDIMKLLVNK